MSTPRLTSLLPRAAILALIWWSITEGAPSSWWLGVPAVLLALTVSIRLLPPLTLVWYELVKFIPFFLVRSLLGGLDVARRAFHPAMPIAPDLIEYPLRLPPGLPRVFMVNTVNLLPGTLSAALGQQTLTVHVLDRRTAFLAELEAVEQSIARMFGISLNSA